MFTFKTRVEFSPNVIHITVVSFGLESFSPRTSQLFLLYAFLRWVNPSPFRWRQGNVPEISSVYFKEKTLWAGLVGEQVLTFARRMTMGIFQSKSSAEGNHSQSRLRAHLSQPLWSLCQGGRTLTNAQPRWLICIQNIWINKFKKRIHVGFH